MRVLTIALLSAAAVLAGQRPARAQGCILIRNNAPVFGESGSLPTAPKEWQVYLTYRDSTADHHYNGIQYQAQRTEKGTNVVNNQKLFDVTAIYSATPRLSVEFGIPFVDASWSVPLPVGPTPGERSQQSASGIGDVSVTAKYWVLDPTAHARGNWSAGIGLKAPTGQDDAKVKYADITGGNMSLKAVDQSIQPGDGGWGILLNVQGYRQLGHANLFGAATYLANPRDTNGTPSIVSGLGVAGNPALAGLDVNSVPDQYLLRAGVSVPILRDTLSFSAAFRVEGVPRYDLIGGSHGWRRPGYETFAEPGLTYSYGRSSWSVYIPIGMVRNRQANPYTGMAGDATFPDYFAIVTYAYRFRNPSAPPQDMTR